MSETFAGKGSCLCGAVRMEAASASHHFDACHCSMCRKWGGGPLMAVGCGSDVQIKGEENVGRFSSSEWAERGFCKQCGTHLFYHLKGNDYYVLPLGLFDNARDMQFHEQVFIEEKPGFYDFANHTGKLTGEELFARFAPPA